MKIPETWRLFGHTHPPIADMLMMGRMMDYVRRCRRGRRRIIRINRRTLPYDLTFRYRARQLVYGARICPVCYPQSNPRPLPKNLGPAYSRRRRNR